MTIVLTGGGSGGHITPLIAIAAELKRREPSAKVIYIGQKGDRFGARLAQEESIDEVRLIHAGKFRRYHSSWLSQMVDIKTLALNFRDLFLFIAGTLESYLLLGRLQPGVVFVKGGFVGVPVGLAAAAHRIPYITHDSDAIPGLANRLIAKWAKFNTVALPASEYKNYPESKIVSVGVPVRPEFKRVTSSEQEYAKKKLGYPSEQLLVLVTGGGLGADRLNHIVTALAPELLVQFKGINLVHQAGEKLRESVANSYSSSLSNDDLARVTVLGYADNIYNYSAAADVIITRAGATTLAEYGIQGKACIVVPNSDLTGGHQLINASILEKRGAIRVVKEGKQVTAELFQVLCSLLREDKARLELANGLGRVYRKDAAQRIAELLLTNINRGKV